jgi:hypothetical protein
MPTRGDREGCKASDSVVRRSPHFLLVDRSAVGAATLLACYTLALLALAVATFRRRDIT